ncbi:MAG TPA: CAP domain-containing protein [Candidatus Binatia bacterium]|nr:CAP domain-containing protein [Candidatus Binatia bacterium]
MSAIRSNVWRAGLIASLVANVLLFVLWLGALNAAPGEESPGADTVVVVVTATPGSSGGALAQVPSPTMLPPSTNTATPTQEPTATVASSATPVPTETATPIPTGTPLPTPTATPLPAPTPSWLGYVNRFREEGEVPPVSEDVAWSLGSEEHSRYTVKTDFISHSEDNSNPWYSLAGSDAAQNGNLAATIWYEAPAEWAVDYWISAPFHALPMLDPQLQAVGFGWYREQDGGVVFAANMDILRGLNQELVDFSYPIMFPRDGGTAWVRQSVLYEYPDPLTACPGYSKPTGPPIILQMGTGRGTPIIGGSSFRSGDQVLDHCVFGENTYVNPDAAAQQSGRRILDVRDAIVLIPRVPLQPDKTYTASILADGQQVTWSFTAVSGP